MTRPKKPFNLTLWLVAMVESGELMKYAKMPWEFMPEKFSPPEQQAAD